MATPAATPVPAAAVAAPAASVAPPGGAAPMAVVEDAKKKEEEEARKAEKAAKKAANIQRQKDLQAAAQQRRAERKVAHEKRLAEAAARREAKAAEKAKKQAANAALTSEAAKATIANQGREVQVTYSSKDIKALIQADMAKYGTVEVIKSGPTMSCYTVRFAEEKDAAKAVQTEKSTLSLPLRAVSAAIDGQFVVFPSVEGMNRGDDKVLEEIKALFGQFGAVRSLTWQSNHCVVCFTDVPSKEKALAKADAVEWRGTKLDVLAAIPKKMKMKLKRGRDNAAAQPVKTNGKKVKTEPEDPVEMKQ